MGQLLQVKFRPKTRSKYDMPQKHYFLPEGKIKWPWVEYEEEKA